MGKIGFDRKNFIAEIGVNHENDLHKALQMVRECADLGVGTVKFQSYRSERLAAPYSPSYWNRKEEPTSSQAELFSKYDHFGKDEYLRIFEFCDEHDIEFMTTPFDTDYVEELSPLLQRYKVASVDITNFLLLEAIATQGKPVVLSTGAASLQEINNAVSFLQKRGVSDITLLHCIINYPTAMADAGLGSIRVLKAEFPDLQIGYSDHTRPADSMAILPLAVALGATVIEKHYTFDKSLPGNDHYHSFDKGDLEQFLRAMEGYNEALGLCNIDLQQDALQYARRGLYATTDLPAGIELSKEHIEALRPKLDFACPSSFSELLGKKLLKPVNASEGIKWSDLE